MKKLPLLDRLYAMTARTDDAEVLVFHLDEEVFYEIIDVEYDVDEHRIHLIVKDIESTEESTDSAMDLEALVQ